MDHMLSHAVDLRVLLEKNEEWGSLKEVGFASLAGLLLYLVLDSPTWFAVGVSALLLAVLISARSIEVLHFRVDWARFALEHPDVAHQARNEVKDMKADKRFWRGLNL